MNDNLIEQPAPDPAWDYYVTWHQIIEAKNVLDQALMLLLIQEEASKDCDTQLNKYLSNVKQALERIALPPERAD